MGDTQAGRSARRALARAGVAVMVSVGLVAAGLTVADMLAFGRAESSAAPPTRAAAILSDASPAPRVHLQRWERRGRIVMPVRGRGVSDLQVSRSRVAYRAILHGDPRIVVARPASQRSLVVAGSSFGRGRVDQLALSGSRVAWVDTRLDRPHHHHHHKPKHGTKHARKHPKRPPIRWRVFVASAPAWHPRAVASGRTRAVTPTDLTWLRGAPTWRAGRQLVTPSRHRGGVRAVLPVRGVAFGHDDDALVWVRAHRLLIRSPRHDDALALGRDPSGLVVAEGLAVWTEQEHGASVLRAGRLIGGRSVTLWPRAPRAYAVGLDLVVFGRAADLQVRPIIDPARAATIPAPGRTRRVGAQFAIWRHRIGWIVRTRHDHLRLVVDDVRRGGHA